ncbi:MAG: hypothetical protein IAE80_23845 [Anaerolinea sp.]|nr:hypothetical protein [Anaerolinea sp.]
MNTKRIFIIVLALAAIFALGISTAAAQSGNGNGGQGGGMGGGYQGGRNGAAPRGNANGGGFMLNLPPASATLLPDEVIDLMIDGWMDEQHAFAVYQAVIDQFGAVRPFTNIQTSEAQHIAAWETLFARYGIDVPEIPTFDLPVFASVSDACSIGVAAEIANFDLYDAMLVAFEPYPDLLYVAQNLRDASEFSHLPAFENCAG